MSAAPSRTVAVLGPTNTGKTHYAVERMLAHRTGVIGLPLRLLAREVYDRIVALRGPSVVALVTGEERIVPPRTAYWVATVEAMPEGLGPDFLAIDEIQLCADPERGHVFTDRLLHARGQHETLFLGAETMRSAIAAMVPGVQFLRRERFSDLAWAGSKKISRMPPRSAIVGFSVENVYGIAEVIRRQKGGAAVVMGALSPRTRNAQVEMYQTGEVDFLVATDAIGMGLNLDIDHVAFSGLRKFDGRRMRDLAPSELAQIAGRAGRYRRPGTFGTTGEAHGLDEEVARAICAHQFPPVRKLQWRSAALDFGSPERLVASLEAPPPGDWLARARDSDDLLALKALAARPEVAERAAGPAEVRRLWEVCRIPDFRGISEGEHAGLLGAIFAFLAGGGTVPDDWLARQVRRIDRTDGGIDALSKRLAYIRTWTYVAQRPRWVEDEEHWRGTTREVEDRLSDALHGALTQRFVDRRTSVLLRRLKQKEALLAEVNDKGEVSVEGQLIGRMEGFRFRQDRAEEAGEARALRQAAVAALAPHFNLRADRFYNAPDTEIDFTDQGGLMWGDTAVGRLVPGADPLKPKVKAFVDDEAGPDVAQKVERRLQHFIDRRVATLFEPLIGLQRDEALTGAARGFAYRMVEALGVLPRAAVADDVKTLEQDARASLRRHGIRFGQFTVFLPALLKPAPTRLRLVLWALANGLDEFPESPPPGLVTVPVQPGAPEGYDIVSGYRAAGQRAIRIDMLERLADMIRAQDTRAGFEAKPEMLSITGMTLEQFADLMRGLGYRAERGERPRARAEAAPQPSDATVGAAADGSTDVADSGPGAGPYDGPDPAPQTDAAPQTEAPAEDAVVASVALEDADTSDPEGSVEAPEAADPSLPPPDEAEIDAAAGGTGMADALPDQEVFYTFRWGGNRPARGGQRRGQGAGDTSARRKDRPREAAPQDGPKGRGRPPRGAKPKDAPREAAPKVYSARPERKDRIDPDNPFAAALMGLKKD